MSTPTLDDETTTTEIQDFYERVGLGSMQARAQFDAFRPVEPRLMFEVVTTTTSQPFVD
ncbi:hypothetical protein [Georgenia thermotolerans]|uniref:Uncharacterized protein n=1 Tax=Georgenia thermotolerans TaxID=527326 RepID=A0A7J5UMR0_9MICO|nr:hypothetical protein [Georgenia thermotolerans]KAE8763223.1 hypothetical protein GB883_15355 [Georgenia thermotolerans]